MHSPGPRNATMEHAAYPTETGLPPLRPHRPGSIAPVFLRAQGLQHDSAERRPAARLENAMGICNGPSHTVHFGDDGPQKPHPRASPLATSSSSRSPLVPRSKPNAKLKTAASHSLGSGRPANSSLPHGGTVLSLYCTVMGSTSEEL